MNGPFKDQAELQQLLDALCEQTISLEQMRRLEELLLANPQAEAYYVLFMSQCADLREYFSADQANPQALGPAPQAGSESGLPEPKKLATASRLGRFVRSRRALLWTGVAATLLVSTLVGLKLTATNQVEPEEPTDYSVAVLLQAPGARWHPSDEPPRPGAPLLPGWLILESGLAQIEFYNGATVILEGPARLELVSRSEAYCASGKLRALVPPQAHGFTVR